MKKINRLLIMIIIFTTLVIMFNINIYADSKGANEVLIEMLNKASLNDINYLQNINITENEYKEIEKFTIDLVKECKDDEEKMKTIFSWVHNNVKYGNANNDPYEVFINKVGVCQGYANLYTVMMDILDIPTVLIQGNTYFGAHAWCLTKIGENWLLMDPTNAIIRYDIKEYDEIYTNSYFTPIYIHTILLEDSYYKYTYNNGVAIVESKTDNKKLQMPDEIKGLNITTFCISALSTNTEELKLNKYVDKIIYNEQYRNNLKAISIDPNNTKFASYKNILYTKDYSNITFIPNNIEVIELKPIKNLEKGTLSNLEYVNKVVIPYGTEFIGDYCFEMLPNLKEVYIPNSVTKISSNAFYNIGSEFIIYTSNNSAAHKFALEHNIKFILLDIELNKGDLDKNGAVNANDAAVALDLYKYGNATDEDMQIGDMNNDGVINANDAALILDVYKYCK